MLKRLIFFCALLALIVSPSFAQTQVGGLCDPLGPSSRLTADGSLFVCQSQSSGVYRWVRFEGAVPDDAVVAVDAAPSGACDTAQIRLLKDTSTVTAYKCVDNVWASTPFVESANTALAVSAADATVTITADSDNDDTGELVTVDVDGNGTAEYTLGPTSVRLPAISSVGNLTLDVDGDGTLDAVDTRIAPTTGIRTPALSSAGAIVVDTNGDGTADASIGATSSTLAKVAFTANLSVTAATCGALPCFVFDFDGDATGTNLCVTSALAFSSDCDGDGTAD